MITVSYRLDEATLTRFMAVVRSFEKNGDHPTRGANVAFNEMLLEAEELLRNRWRVNFNSGGGMYGAWWPLDPDTVEAKRGRGGPLVNTGKMRSKFFGSMYGRRSAQGVEWNFRNYRGLLFHHFGTTHEWARPLVGINESDKSAVRGIVAKHARQFVNIAWQNAQG